MKTTNKIIKTLFGAVLSLLITFGLTHSAAAQTPPPSGLVGWWPGNGDATDIIGGNNGTLLGGASFTAAKVGQGFNFDSDDDGVTIAHNTALDVNLTGFTADFWMQGIKNQPESLYLVVDKSHGHVDSTGWLFQGDSSTGEIFFGIGNGGAGNTDFTLIGSVADVLDGNFHHIAGTWDGATMRLYVDCVFRNSTALATPANNTRNVNLGFHWALNGIRFFRGKVDELKIFNRALTAEEIGDACDGCPNASFADDAIIWHQPLARNGASEDTDPSAGRTVKYRFKRGSTIPIQIHALGCTVDVTSNANVIGKVTVFGDSNCDGAMDDNAAPIDFNGVGGGGGVMDKIGGHLKYNLDSKSLPTTTQCYILRVTVTDTSTGEEKFEEVLLQAK